MNIFQLAEETQVDQRQDGATNAHEDAVILELL
jgi:hypothetical protein